MESEEVSVPNVTTRYGKSNNKCMGETFDENESSKFITYLDANNLYGWAMSKPLPVGEFSWMTEDELNNWKDYGGCTPKITNVPPQSSEDKATFPKTLSLEELRSKAKQLGMSGYEPLSEVVMRLCIEGDIEYDIDVDIKYGSDYDIDYENTTEHNDYVCILEVDL